jgi:exodeoxyribonuclease V alpha subunit
MITVAAEGFAEPVTVSGVLPVAGTGLPVKVEGEWRYHDEHGPQIDAASIKATLPTTEPGLKAYLASGAVPGIGPTTAFWLVDRFGVGVLSVAADQPERLGKVKGLTKAAADALGRIARELTYTALNTFNAPVTRELKV